MQQFQLRTLKVMMTSRQGVDKQHMSLRCHCQVTVAKFDNILIDLHADPDSDIRVSRKRLNLQHLFSA